MLKKIWKISSFKITKISDIFELENIRNPVKKFPERDLPEIFRCGSMLPLLEPVSRGGSTPKILGALPS